MTYRLHHFSVFTLLLLFLFLFSCKSKNPAEFAIDSEFQSYVSSFTSGVISAASPITIQLQEPNENKVKPNEPIEDKLFSISPSIKGKTVWVDQYTLQFIPEENFKSGETYWVDFKLGKVATVPKDLEVFKFPFTIIEQAVNFEVDGLKSYESDFAEWYQFTGTAYTSDVIEVSTLEEIFEVKVNGDKKSLKWEQIGNGNLYELTVDSIPRKEKAGEIQIAWNRKTTGGSDIHKVTERIPALGDFEVIQTSVTQHPEQYVLVRFSDPLLVNQNIDGLVEIKNVKELKTSVSTNELRIYPSTQLQGTYSLVINGAIKNSKGYKYGQDEVISVDFQAIKPAIRFVGNGNILPSTNNMVVAFEAVNLKAIDVRITKVFENNIIQFFQSNDFSGGDGLRRIGRVIRKKTISLDKGNPLDLGKWNRFNLDLSEYIKVEQGAIYRVEIGFRKYHSTYPCDATSKENIQMDETDWDEDDHGKSENWDYVNDWNSDYYNYNWFDGFDWDKEDDPCSYSYYRDNSIAKNIFASDIGIIAKTGSNGESMVVVTDLISAAPISEATVRFYDFQQQILTKVLTDKNGIATTKPKSKPFFVMAEAKGQKGYLRLGEGNSLSLSRFDVDGSKTQDGIKGYIYGERGVWRPGDTLFLNFILEDKEGNLPKDHPVIFELYNARGQMVKRDVKTTSLHGFYNFTTPTDPSSPTGNWLAKVDVGGATFTKTVKVETIKPNRLKVNLKFDEETITSSNPYISGSLTSTWLHGAPAKNLKADISLKFVSTKTVFKDYKNYTFDDPSKSFNSESELFLEQKLNAEGKLTFNKKYEISDDAPGMLKAIFTTRVFEQGGDFSMDQIAVNYAPYEYFTGIQSPEINKYGALETDKDYQFPIVTIDKEGQVKGNRKLKVEVYRIEWSWWWESSSDNVANYINRSNVSPISSETITSNASGKATAKINIDKHDWGRYYIKVTDLNGKHSAGIFTYFDWPDWMSRSGRETPSGANMLTFSTDKKEYETGEKAKISFPSSKNGHALISIENGSRVIDAFWIKTDASETTFNLPITPYLAPNCYVHITFLQPHKNTENDAPIRMYGVMPVMVKDPETILEPEIKMPDELAPNSTFEIEVKEKNKKNMTYTIAVVDEGLLDLTRFQTPNPWSRFYAREALGVKTWDMFDFVIGAYGAKVENLLTIGGDESINPGEETPIRFKPMVRFIGPFTLKGGKTAKHKIDVPNYIGSVRTMVVAGQAGAYGNTEKTTPVKKPLMILSTLPRVLGPKETVILPVNVFAMDKKVKEVTIQVKTNGLLKTIGTAKKQISFNNIGDQVVNFELEVGSLIGTATVEIIATSGKEKATEKIELSVRHPNLPVTYYNEGSINAKGEWSNSIDLPGIEGSNSAKLELSTIPPINLEKRLDYLIQYPHGCIEQKTSGAFPQLYLESLIDIDAKTKVRIDNNVRSVLNKLQRHQVSSGGFAFWEGGGSADDWGTSYGGHFMLEAEKKGFNLPYGLKEKWINYQKEASRNWSPRINDYYANPDLPQAYRLYTLALAGEPLLSAMNKLRSQPNLSIQAAWRLAGAYQIIGKDEVAKELVKNKSMKVKPYTELSYSYGNNHRDEAMIIEVLTLMGEKAKAANLVKDLSTALSKDRWMSTQTTAYSLMAIAKFTENNKPKGGLDATYEYNGKSVVVKGTKAIQLIDLPIINAQKSAQVKVKNNGSSFLFARIITSGIPLAGNEKEFEKDLRLDVVYKNSNGKIITVGEIEQGTDFSVEVTVSNPGVRGNYQDLALSQIFPSGWEIHNQRMDIGYDGGEGDYIDYQDIRDDRVYSYFSLRKNQSKTIKTYLHAAYIGEYYMPATYIEAMYDATISALKKGQKTKVVLGGN